MSVQDIISIFYPEAQSRLGELVVDGFVHETHTLASRITEHPIESGGSIVDHVDLGPFTLAIEGIISNTPMAMAGLVLFDSAKRYMDGSSNDFAVRAFEKIEEMFRKREPLSIATSLKIYHSMVLETMNIERGGGAHDALRFSCTAKQVKLVQQEKITIPAPKVSRAKPKKKQGLQEAKPLSQEKAEGLKKDSSFLFSVGKWFLGN